MFGKSGVRVGRAPEEEVFVGRIPVGIFGNHGATGGLNAARPRPAEVEAAATTLPSVISGYEGSR